MTEEEIKAAKLEAYDKGYRAGSRRLAADRIERGTAEAYHAMWDTLFVAMLQIAHQRDWTVEGQLIELRDERCKLAADWATAAMQARTLYRP